MRTIMKWVALVVLTLPIHLVLVLALIGVPKPPAITAEGIGRVGWRPVLDDAARLTVEMCTPTESATSCIFMGLRAWVPLRKKPCCRFTISLAMRWIVFCRWWMDSMNHFADSILRLRNSAIFGSSLASFSIRR